MSVCLYRHLHAYFHQIEYVDFILKAPPIGHNGLHQDGRHIGLMPDMSLTNCYPSHPGARRQGRDSVHVNVSMSLSSSLCIFPLNPIYKSHFKRHS